jgi:phosphoribosylformylglycinamidine synthase
LSAGKVGRLLRIPIAHGEGCYVADAATLAELNREGRVLLRYCDAAGEVTTEANPNGSAENIAGLCNAARNVFGLMPHPERACDARLGSTDGRVVFESILATLGARKAA